MNKVFIIGEIKKIKYGLVDKGKIYSISIIDLKVDKSKYFIKAICKNEEADYIYKHAKICSNIVIEGMLRNKGNQYIVLINNIEAIF